METSVLKNDSCVFETKIN